MTERELRERLNSLAGNGIPAETHRAFLSAVSPGKEKIRMKKKISAGLVFALILVLLAVAAVGAGIYNLDWWYNNRNGDVSENPEAYRAVMAHLTEDPEQQQSGDGPVNVAIRDVSWAPEASTLIISFSAAVKEPEKYELYSLWALNEDGEDREEQWLWRGEPDLEVNRHGPVKEMMDDSSKTALFIELVNYDFMALKPFVRSSSMDEYRTPEGEVVYVAEFGLEWLNEEYDRGLRDYAEEHPEMKEYNEQKIETAKRLRTEIGETGVPCVLHYRTVVYREGMDGRELYEGGDAGQVSFVIRTGNE